MPSWLKTFRDGSADDGSPEHARGPLRMAVLSHAALLLAWYLFIRLGEVPRFVMPSPVDTFGSLLSANYDWWANTRVTATEIFGGYFLALIVGVLLALGLHLVQHPQALGAAASGDLEHDPQGGARPALHRLVQVRCVPQHDDGLLHRRLPDPAQHREGSS
jgi:hypothetical protein